MIGLAMMLASGGFFSGTQFYDLCQKDRASCILFVEATVDSANSTLDALERSRPACYPSGTRASELTDVAVQYFRSHPDERQYIASSTIMLSLIKAYPCNQG